MAKVGFDICATLRGWGCCEANSEQAGEGDTRERRKPALQLVPHTCPSQQLLALLWIFAWKTNGDLDLCGVCCVIPPRPAKNTFHTKRH